MKIYLYKILFIVTGLAVFCSCLDLEHELKTNPLKIKKHFDELNKVAKTMQKLKPSVYSMHIDDMSVECALCGVAINEIEGFVQENVSVTEVEKYLNKDFCAHLGGEFKVICDDIISQLPHIISTLEHRWDVSVVCVDLGYCKKPFGKHNETTEVPTYVIDLDKPPYQRFLEVCSIEEYQKQAQFLVNVVKSVLADGGKYLSDVGKAINFFFPSEFGQEIQGCASKLGVDYGWLSLMNIGYEVSDACTSIVSQDINGKIYHGRNLDFWSGMGFTDSLKNMTFIGNMQKSGKTSYYMTTFAGMVGALSGQRPHVFSVTVDTRFYPKGIGELFYEVIAAITEKNATMVAFLSREALSREGTFEEAVYTLSNSELIADVYYIAAGVSNDEGAVISRNRINATNVWRLDVPNRWFEVETNYDHWKPAPWFDDRRAPANAAMKKMGRNGLNVDNLFNVMSTKPVLNLQTTYTIISIPADGYYKSYTRYCPYPCVQ